MQRDPYLVLGVDRKATQEEINRAFRSLASKHHPDRNPDDPKESSDRFKEVAAAYELLGDEGRRKQYDFYSNGQLPSFSFRSRNAVDNVFDNLFSQFFGPGGRPAAAKSRVRITLAECLSGCVKKVKSESYEKCPDCTGTGSSEWSRCARCEGQGYLFTSEGTMRIQTACVHCSGRGSVSKQSCRRCNGRGQTVSSEREVEVRIPAGVEEGMHIRLPGEADGGGDLFVVVSVDKHPSIARQQRNLTGSMDCPYATLVMGGERKFDLFGTEISVKIPPRTRAGTRLRIRGHGLPALQNPEVRGDLFIDVALRMPKNMSRAHEEAVARLAKIEGDD